jgi:uncharacterized protein with von Willebrand factor type A (vWA) domain
MIEIKLIWSGSGIANSLEGINNEKLESCLGDGTTKSAFLVLLDGLDSKHKPYLQDSLKKLKKNSVENPKETDFWKY